MCFSLEWFESVIIWLIIVGGVIALLRLLLPKVLPFLGWGGDFIVQAITIVVRVVIAIFVVIFVFDLIFCLIGMGGGWLRLPLHR